MPKLIVNIPRSLKEAIRSYAHSQSTTMTEITLAALTDYLNPDEYKTASLRHLGDLSRKMDVILSREEAVLETIGRFVLIYLMHTPPLPDHELAAAKTEGRARYESFQQRLSESLYQNRTFLAALEQRFPGPQQFYFSHQENTDES